MGDEFMINEYYNGMPSMPHIIAEEQNEVFAVLESLAHGNLVAFGNIKIQAHTAAISSPEHIKPVLDSLRSNVKIKNAKNIIYAYRLTCTQEESADPDQPDDFIEAYDDDGEEGAGEKLLFLLQKMDVQDILVLVSIWHQNIMQTLQPSLYRNIVQTAKDLLEELQVEVLEVQKQEEKEHIKVQRETEGTAEYSQLKARVFSYSKLPKKQEPMTQISPQKIVERPNYFMSQTIESTQDEPEDDDITEEELYSSVEGAKDCLMRLTKPDIIEIKNLVIPHPLVEKVLYMICILKGFANPTWQIAKEFLNPITFKNDLNSINIASILPAQINKITGILGRNRLLSPEILDTISRGGSILLEWVMNMIVVYRGYIALRNNPQEFQNSPMSRMEENDQIIENKNIYTLKQKDDVVEETKEIKISDFLEHKHKGSLRTITKSGKSKQGYFIKAQNVILDPKVHHLSNKMIIQASKDRRDLFRKSNPFDVELPNIDYSNFKDSTVARLIGKDIPDNLRSHVDEMYTNASSALETRTKKKGTGKQSSPSDNETSSKSGQKKLEVNLNPSQIVENQEKTNSPLFLSTDSEDEAKPTIDHASVDEHSTDTLIALAEKLKAKRIAMYPE